MTDLAATLLGTDNGVAMILAFPNGETLKRQRYAHWSMDARPPRKIIGQNVYRNSRQKQTKAKPEQGRMVDASPVAPTSGVFHRVSWIMFFIHCPSSCMRADRPFVMSHAACDMSAFS